VSLHLFHASIPLSLGRLRRVEEQPLVDAVAARIPTWKSGLLTKVTLSAIPVHLSIACCMSSWGINQIDKRRRAFLWSGTGTVAGGKCKVAWPVVCRPTDLGGLGVLDLRFFGFALRLRWEWLARAEPERCWASLPAGQNGEAGRGYVCGCGQTTGRRWADYASSRRTSSMLCPREGRSAP